MDRDFSLSNNGDWNQLNKEVKITRTSQNFMQEGIFVHILLQKEFERLKRILDHLTVQHAVFLRDLFHSPWNRECDEFEVYLQQFKDIALLLNISNHDIFHEALLHQLHVMWKITSGLSITLFYRTNP